MKGKPRRRGSLAAHSVTPSQGIDAKLGVLAADGVLHVQSALIAPRLDRVHVSELKDNDAVGRFGAAR